METPPMGPGFEKQPKTIDRLNETIRDPIVTEFFQIGRKCTAVETIMDDFSLRSAEGESEASTTLKSLLRYYLDLNRRHEELRAKAGTSINDYVERLTSIRGNL
jgi:hypothetical protein